MRFLVIYPKYVLPHITVTLKMEAQSKQPLAKMFLCILLMRYSSPVVNIFCIRQPIGQIYNYKIFV